MCACGLLKGKGPDADHVEGNLPKVPHLEGSVMASSRSNRHVGRINRRRLLQHSTVAAGAAIVSGNSPALARQDATPMETNSVGSFDLMDVTVANLREGLDAGDFTVRELVQACLDQIAALDQSGPALNAMLEIS